MRGAFMASVLAAVFTGPLAVQEPKDEPIQEKTPELIDEMVNKLVELQEADGMWPYEGRYRLRGNIPITYRVGGTSLVGMALMYGADKKNKTAQEVFHAGLKYVLAQLDHVQMTPSRKSGYDMRVMAQAYALLFLCHVQVNEVADEKEKELIEQWIPKLVEAIVFEQMDDGGWNYQGRPVHSSFVTASVLQSLLWSRSLGQEVPDEVLQRAANVLESSRFNDGAFFYFGNHDSAQKRQRQDQLPGSIGRSAICESMLYLTGKGSIERIQKSLDSFHRYWDELEKRRQKSGTHEGDFLIAPYYFYYGHRYAAQAIEWLPDAQRAAERERLFQLLMRTRDEDGTWNDREFERSRNYGTAMVLLAMLSDRIPLPPAWNK